MRYRLLSGCILLLISNCIFAQKHSLEKLWETGPILHTPESVLPDLKQHILYVSNIDGQPADKDGKGGISILHDDGTMFKADFVKGLNAPKGLGMYKNLLYVADLTEVVEIDRTTGTILKKIPVPGAVFLNDIAVNHNGIVYVSDTRANKVYKIEKGFVAPIAENMQGPNGLYSLGDDLLVLDHGRLLRILADGGSGIIATGMDPSTDGLEQVKPNEYIVSAWNGVIYYVQNGRAPEVMLDTRAEKKNTADIGYNPSARIVYVPTFYGNSVIAYRLK